ncbi:hypothetical protein F5Y03DRAFT_389042 [Xylaria venustula]|nr:hypothetical protein F5Y03DRAFT_389042 [Xylaria venustula]
MSLALVHPRSLVSLEPTEYYGLYVGLGFVLLLAYPAFSLIRMLCGRANDHLWFFWQLLLPVWLCGRRIILGYEAIMFCLFLAANTLSIVIGSANDTTELIRRLGQVAIINLVPTFLGAHMNHAANAYGFHYERYARLHTWLAGVGIVEVVSHTVLAVKQTGYDGPAHHITGILASSSIGAIAVFSVPVIRRRMFELFTYIHTLLVTAALVAIWLHLPPSSFQRGPRLYLLLSSFIFASTKVGRLLNVIYLSISFSAGGSVATVQEQGGGVEVRVRLARPLRFKAGQYIYLSLWRLSTLSIFESHPFQICWAYRDESDQQVIVLLAQPRRGFTSRLLGPAPRKYRALIERPYGKSLSLGESGTVLLLATRELNAEVHRYWVKDWMDELLALDKDYILDMQLYIPGRFLSRRASKSTVKKLGTHGRIKLTYAAMRADQLIASEIAQRKGRTLVSLCTHATTTRAVVEVVRSFGGQNIQTEILDFQP